MLKKIWKDKFIRKKVKQEELKKILLKTVSTKMLNEKKHIKCSFIFNYKRVSKVKIRRRCVLTNRSRGVLTSYNLSRTKLRELLHIGILPGYKKSVW